MNNNFGEKVIASLVVLGIILVIGLFASADAPKCIEYGCDRDQASGSSYCYVHKPYKKSYSTGKSNNTSSKVSTSSPSSSKSSATGSASGGSKKYSSNSGSRWESYDAGYEDVYDNEDYDYDRYESDPEYANGVDDAMEDVYEEYGEEW